MRRKEARGGQRLSEGSQARPVAVTRRDARHGRCRSPEVDRDTQIAYYQSLPLPGMPVEMPSEDPGAEEDGAALEPPPAPTADSVEDDRWLGFFQLPVLGRVFLPIFFLALFTGPWVMWASGPIGPHNPVRWLTGPYGGPGVLLVFYLVGLGLLIFDLPWPPTTTRSFSVAPGHPEADAIREDLRDLARTGRRFVFGYLVVITLLVADVVGVFATVYVQVAHDQAVAGHRCFSPAHFSHLDAVYFAVGTLSTAGSGQVSPSSQLCRGLATGQMVIGMIVLGFIVAGVAARLIQSTTEKW